jgi:Ca2+-binding RTX toxin-like protein
VGLNVENLTFTGAGNFAGTGNILANIITGAGGNDTLKGLTGNDTLNGAGGNDLFLATAGDGNDSYIGGAGVDTYDLSQTAANATANLALGTSTSLDTGNNSLATIENVIGSQGNDTITGSIGNNNLNGFSGNDTINGGAGVDTLIGGLGNDIMNGGTGNDFFVFAAGFGSDTINGFDAIATLGQDIMNLTAFGITAGTFAARVVIVDLGANTQVTIDGADSILLLGVNGVGTNAITVADFTI